MVLIQNGSQWEEATVTISSSSGVLRLKRPHIAAHLAREHGLHLLIGGRAQTEAEQQFLKEEVQPFLGHGVEYIGEISDDKKLQLLGEAKALINPITWPEPFGLVMIEALACGTPVVTLAAGAAPEIVDHGVTGFVCTSADELADACTRVEAIDRSACRAVVEQYFCIQRMVRDHVLLFRRLIAEH